MGTPVSTPEVVEATVYDLLAGYFGVGDWDATTSTEPYWRHRVREIAKVKAVCRSRGVTPRDLAVAAHYCHAHGIDVRAVTWLLRHVLDARAWSRARARDQAEAAFEDELVEAIAAEHALGAASVWLEPLRRARGEHREEVLRAWRESRFSGDPPPASSAGSPSSGT